MSGHSGMAMPQHLSQMHPQQQQQMHQQQIHQQMMMPGHQQQHQHQPQSMNHSTRVGNYVYALEVVQQPDRARMCGFGDKDRRPITPPPCVRLVIRDADTNVEIDYSTVDSQHFVLSVDIWNKEGTVAANEVKHSNTSPSISISMASLTSYPPPAEHYPLAGMYPNYGNGLGGRGGPYPQSANYGYGAHPPYTGAYATSNPGTFQRNLIGSLSVSASLLEDTAGKAGYWFVLQDLSVRTEGSFRLRLSFMDLSIPTQGATNITTLTAPSKVPILAYVFTDFFQVYSAKRFPGVKESTELSKKFAQQGVKIPIRKDTGGPVKKRGSDEDDGAEE